MYAGMTESLIAGQVTTLGSVGLFADGAAVKTVGQETFRVSTTTTTTTTTTTISTTTSGAAAVTVLICLYLCSVTNLYAVSCRCATRWWTAW